MICSLLIRLVLLLMRDERGSHVIEFAFIVMLISAVLIPMAQTFGGVLAETFAIYMP
jgi:Flp pilus assembly pilin Flp